MSSLFDNEEIRKGDGYESLIRFFDGDPNKPLVVFSPGWAFLGRVSYGFPESDPNHFLAHWIKDKGYPFLAISYPLDHPVYSDPHPEFCITTWGEMAAQITQEIIIENNLDKNVIGINWSASGQAIRPFNVACKSRGINVRFTLALEASPAMQFPTDRIKGLKKTGNNMISLKDSHFDLFWKELQEQSRISGEQILSEKQYKDYLWGDIPVAITGGNEFFENGEFINDPSRAIEDKGFFSFDEYPFLAVISGNSASFPYHPIVDRSTWAFLNTRKIYNDYISNAPSTGFEISPQKLKEFVSYVNSIPDLFGSVIEGTHFLFVGKKGAKGVAEQLEIFDQSVDKIKSDISGILS